MQKTKAVLLNEEKLQNKAITDVEGGTATANAAAAAAAAAAKHNNHL